MLATLGDQLCLDLDQVFVTGESNGGMMSHRLARAMPSTFAAVLPIYGLPLRGTAAAEPLPANLSETSFLQLFDRWDNVIPPDGQLSSQGWYYDTVNETVKQWVDLHGCDAAATNMTTPFDGGARRLECVQHEGCDSGRLVALCWFDGLHGNWLEDAILENLSWWFVQQAQHAARRLSKPGVT